MITYEKYAEIRKSKGFKNDADVCRVTGIPQSTFSEWKNGRYTPKYDKMSKIAEAFDMEYSEFVGVYGKFSGLNPDKPVPHLYGMMPDEEKIDDFDKELLRLYHNATSEAQLAVMTVLKNSQKEPLKSSKEA